LPKKEEKKQTRSVSRGRDSSAGKASPRNVSKGKVPLKTKPKK
jgi:hypothetical protein